MQQHTSHTRIAACRILMLAYILVLSGLFASLARATPPPLKRVVSLAPHITELIYAAGAGHYLIATVDSSDYPPAAKNLPRVGTGITLSNEHLLTLNPDAVIAWQASQAAVALSPSLNKLAIAQLYSAPQRLTDIPHEIRRFGRLFGTETIAMPYADALDQRIHQLTSRYKKAKTVAVFIEVESNPLYTIGKDPLINDMLASCGAVNVYGHSRVGAPHVNIEDLLLKNPMLVLITSRNPTVLTERLHYWQRLQLPAAQKEHIFRIDPDSLYRPGPRLIDAAAEICAMADTLR